MIIGLPAMSMRGLPGKRVEAYRAGRTPTWEREEEGMGGEVCDIRDGR